MTGNSAGNWPESVENPLKPTDLRQIGPNSAKLELFGAWIVQTVDRCTCGSGSIAGYGHEPGCGCEPILNLDDLDPTTARAVVDVLLKRPDIPDPSTRPH